jgi:quercetin dioxygenase-like cupin family protein
LNLGKFDLIKSRNQFLEGSTVDIYRAGSKPTQKSSSDWFTGTVWQDPIVEAPEPARVRAVKVTFEPGARTAWHTHPLGQTLHLISGVGLIGLRDDHPKIINAGDTVWIPPNEEHWHGATPTNSMTHIAIQESMNGTVANWLEKVADPEYSSLYLSLRK